MPQEPVLLFDDFGGHFQDRLGTLVEALGQPVRRIETIDKEGLFLRVAGFFGNRGIIDPVDQNPRQHVGIELDLPSAVIAAFDEHIGHHRLHRRKIERPAWTWIEFAQFGQHVENILAVRPDLFAQQRQIVTGHQIEMGQQPGHHGIQPVLFGQLDRQAFRKRARKNPKRLAPLHLAQHGLDGSGIGTELLGDLVDLGHQIPALVEVIDEAAGDQPFGGVVYDQVDLIGQMVGQRDLGGHILVDIGRLAAQRAALAFGPRARLAQRILP